MTYEEEEENKKMRIIDLTENPWSSNTPEDLDRQSSMIADTYIKTRLKDEPNGLTSSTVKNDIESLYSVKDETLKRYSIRKIAYDPRVESSIRDYSKSDDYYLQYKYD
jgi:hypothetical protein